MEVVLDIEDNNYSANISNKKIALKMNKWYDGEIEIKEIFFEISAY